MLNNNLKKLRKSKGLSQEELATKLCVVRQTISKWEQGLSVPDSEMLIRIAEEFDTTVSTLLGENVSLDNNSEIKVIAEKLEVLNDSLAKKSERNRKIWRTSFIVVGIVSLISILRGVIASICYQQAIRDIQSSVSTIGGADGPTNVFVSNMSLNTTWLTITIVAIIVSVIGICLTRKK